MLQPRSFTDQAHDLYRSSVNGQRWERSFENCNRDTLQSLFDAMLALHRTLDLIDRHHTGVYLSQLKQLLG